MSLRRSASLAVVLVSSDVRSCREFAVPQLTERVLPDAMTFPHPTPGEGERVAREEGTRFSDKFEESAVEVEGEMG